MRCDRPAALGRPRSTPFSPRCSDVSTTLPGELTAAAHLRRHLPADHPRPSATPSTRRASRIRTGWSGGTSPSPISTWTPLEPRWRASGRRDPGGSRSSAPADLPPLRHVLLGINAHINYDLPQALLAVISDDGVRRRGAAGPPAARPRARSTACWPPGSAAEDAELAGRPAHLLDRLLTPLNQAGHPAVPARGAGQGMAQRHRAAPRPAGRARTPTPRGWPSSRC